MRKVSWPEGQPEKAVIVNNPFSSWWVAVKASLSGRRCSRVWPVSDGDNPIVLARACERAIRRQG